MSVCRILRISTLTKCANLISQNVRTCTKLNLAEELRPQRRFITTVGAKIIEDDEGLIYKIKQKLPVILQRSRLLATGYYLYEEIADRIDYIDFFEKFGLPDTFYSWFTVTELHIWLLSVRLMDEGNQGRFIRNAILQAFWADVSQRIKKLGLPTSGENATKIEELSEQLQAALISYDEGLQSDDIVLAGAVWRRFYQQRDFDAQHLNSLVKYIRKQIQLVDNFSKSEIFQRKFRWD